VKRSPSAKKRIKRIMKKLLKKWWEMFKSFVIKNQRIIIHITNYVVLFSIYGINTNPVIDAIIGLWIMLNVAVDGYKLFMKK